MKKIFAFLLLAVLMSFSNQNNSEKFFQSSKKVFKETVADKTTKIHVDFTVTSTGGCSFHIVGDLCYSIWSGHVSCFTGTVTASGSGGCPNGTWNFNWNASTPLNQLKDGELTLALDTEVLCGM